MAVSFIPSRIVRGVIYRELSAHSGVTDVVGDRIHYGLNAPQPGQGDPSFPYCLYLMEQSAFDGAVGTYQYEHILSAEMRFSVQFHDTGSSDARIAAAWTAMMDALAGEVFDEPDGVQVTFSAQGETPVPPFNEGGRRYQRLGTTFSVTVTRGG